MNTFHQLRGLSFALFSLLWVSIGVYAQTYTWNVAGTASWTSSSSWTPSGIPNAVGANAIFGSVAASNVSVKLVSNVTVGSITFSNPSSLNYALITGSTSIKSQITFDVSSGNAQINLTNSGNVTINDYISILLNDNLELNSSGTGILQINSGIGGTGGLIKNGSGYVILNRTQNAQVNYFSGDTVVNAGTLQIGIGGNALVIGGSSNVIINSGGTLIHDGTNKIVDTAKIILNGGTWNLNNFSDTVASLTLSANSIIDMGSSTGTILTFTGGVTYTSGTSLTIENWSGSLSGGGSDQIIFGSSLSSAFLSSVYWSSQGIYGAVQLSTGEIVPILPEASTVFAGIGLVLVIISYELHRRKAKSKANA